jgi:hypothetical protein
MLSIDDSLPILISVGPPPFVEVAYLLVKDHGLIYAFLLEYYTCLDGQYVEDVVCKFSFNSWPSAYVLETIEEVKI